MTSPYLLVSLAACLLASLAVAQCEPQWLQGDPIATSTGYVNDATNWDPDGAGPAAPQLVAVGLISGGQVWQAPVAAWDGSQWRRLGTPPQGEGKSVVVWNGNLVVSAWTGTDMVVASWNGTTWQILGTFDGPFTINGLLLAVHQGSLYAGGSFTSVNGAPAARVARWDGSTWSATGAGPQFAVARLVSFQNVLYAGCNNVVSPGSSQLTTWNGSAWTVVATGNGYLSAMEVRNGAALTNTYLYVGGLFSQWTGVNGTVAGPLVRFSPSANAWASLGFSTSTLVRDLAVRSTGLTTFELLAVDDNGLYQQSGASWVQLGAPVANSRCVTYHNAAWHLLTSYSGSNALAQRLQAGTWVPLNSPPPPVSLGNVRAARAAGSDTIVGSDTGLWQGQPGTWTAIGGLTGSVSKLTRMANGDLVVAGLFAVPGLANGSRIARWDGVAWSSLAYPAIGVNALLPLPNGELVVGGDFVSIDGANIPYLARWSGGAWQPLGGGVNNVVRALARLPNGDIVAGGDFTLAGGVLNTANYVARWNGTSWTGMSAPAPVYALTSETTGTVVALSQGLARRWNGTTWPQVFSGGLEAVITLPDGDLLFAGGTSIQRTDPAGIVRRSSTFVGALRDLALAEDGDILVAGGIQGVDGIASVGVARLDAPCPATSATAGAGCTGSSGPLVLTPTALPWLGSTFRALATGLPPLAFGVAVTGFAPTSLPLLAVFPTAAPGCTLHVQPDLLEVALAAGGAMAVQLVVPNNPSLVGIVVQHQVVSLQFDAALSFTEVTATNSLQSTVGTL